MKVVQKLCWCFTPFSLRRFKEVSMVNKIVQTNVQSKFYVRTKRVRKCPNLEYSTTSFYKNLVSISVGQIQQSPAREDEGRERISHTWASSDENYLKSSFGFVSYWVVILRTTRHWSVRLTSCYFRLLTWKQQIKITFAAWQPTNNKFQIIVMGHSDSLSYFILSCLP